MSRSRRFETRIEIERVVLDVVNKSSLSERSSLVGLTAAAIESWKTRVSSGQDGVQVRQAEAILLSIARETGLLADNSRAVFDVGASQDDASLEQLLAKLRILLHST